MYNHKQLIRQKKAIDNSLDELLKVSEMIYSENIQKTILTYLKSLNLAIEAINSSIGTIFILNQSDKGVHEIFSENPEDDVPVVTRQRKRRKNLLSYQLEFKPNP